MLSGVYDVVWQGENQANISWDFSYPIISFQDISGTCLAMLKGLNLVPFGTIPGFKIKVRLLHFDDGDDAHLVTNILGDVTLSWFSGSDYGLSYLWFSGSGGAVQVSEVQGAIGFE